jgi:quinoprotein glucose dehydrogenase
MSSIVTKYLCLLSIGFVICSCKQNTSIDYTGPISDWDSYGGTEYGERYSKLTQITSQNVHQLKKAWEYNHRDVSNGDNDIPSTTAFEATPIMVDETLYFPTPFNRVIALNPETGEEKWVYDPKIDLKGFYANQLICRGVTYWKNTSNDGSSDRIFTATNDARLLALDAKSGKPCEDFGSKGEVNLLSGVGETRYTGEYQVTSAPAIINEMVIVGSAVADGSRTNAPSGVVRAYHARSGELIWSWDLQPPKDTTSSDLISDVGYLLGGPNVWAPMSTDTERDLLFVPTGNPSPDYYGGQRNNVDFYGSSIVAIRASTGEVVWHFQTVHHDLWDFDVPAQPTLTDIEKDGKVIPAVIQATKMGLFFILNRETGEPIFPIEERPVPQTTVPGEYTSPTQPYPMKPLPLIRHDMSKDEAWGVLGFNGDCKDRFEKLYYEGGYTPPKLGQATLMYPGNSGGSNWGGIAVDRDRQILVANVMDLAWIVTLMPKEEYEQAKKDNPGVEIVPQAGTPYAMRRETFLSGLGLPCNPPPWGTLAAIDLKSGDIMWQDPFGTVRDLAPVPLKIKYGVPNLGGPIVTASGLIFIGATMDNYIRAFEIETGKQVWEERLPAGGQATPMTYRVKATGKQYIVIAAGGHGRAGSKLGDSVIAYALEE